MSKTEFDAFQNVEQMSKTLVSLLHCYDLLNINGVHMPNEAEFRAIYLLNHMDSELTVMNEVGTELGWDSELLLRM
jgi:SAC3/GANP family